MSRQMSLEISVDKKTPFNGKPNMLEINRLYSFTLNPSDEHQYIEDRQRLELVYKYVRKRFNRYSLEYSLYMEVSSPMSSRKNGKPQTPRIHFHGVIMFRNSAQLLNWYSFIFNDMSKYAYFDLDICNDYNIYNAYCRKNLKTMLSLTKDVKLKSLSMPRIEKCGTNTENSKSRETSSNFDVDCEVLSQEP